MNSAAVPEVFVFVPTYRRPEMLRRALQSVLAQTHTRWLCRVHNDAPGEGDGPYQVVKSFNDSRLSYYEPERNLGPTDTFNTFFRGDHVCEFYSILEDDNLWKPDFWRPWLELSDSIQRSRWRGAIK